MPEPQLLTAAEIAHIFRVAESTVYRWARDGAIRSVTVAGTVRFSRVEVEALLAPSFETAPSEPAA